MSDTVKPAYRIPSIVAAICFALAAILFPIHQLLYRSVDVVFDMANPEIVSINSVRAIVNLLITFSFDIIIFVALILLAIFAITAARGKAKTPLFVIGVALWVLLPRYDAKRAAQADMQALLDEDTITEDTLNLEEEV